MGKHETIFELSTHLALAGNVTCVWIVAWINN